MNAARRRGRTEAAVTPIHVARGTFPRALAIIIGLAAVVIVLAGAHAIAWLIGPAFLAFVIVVSCSPIQSWLRRKGCPRWLAGLALVVVVFAVLITLFGVVVIAIGQFIQLLPQYADKAHAAVESVLNLLAKAGIKPPQVDQAASSLDLSKLAGVAESLLAGIGGLLSGLILLLALLLFIALEINWAHERLAAMDEDRPWISSALRRFVHRTRSYMLVTTVFGLIVAILDTVGLAIIGVQAAILWGLLAFVTNFIPNIGFVLGVIPPALIALLDGGWVQAVVVVVVYSVLNLVVQSVIQPMFVGDSVGLSTFVTILSLIFWAWLLGPLGAILAVPATLLCKTLFVDIDPGARWADIMLRSPPKEEKKPKEAKEPPPPAVEEEVVPGEY